MTGVAAPRSIRLPDTAPAIRTLLVEDDDGDAFLVQELLDETAVPVEVLRARTLAEARSALDGVQCVLLDLGLPDTDGLSALWALRDAAPQVALLVLTGYADEHRGLQAVAAGAQDYLVKGQVDAELLGRSIRYAVERRRAEESLRRLYESELYAAENSRLERGLLPVALYADPRLSCVTRYRPGRRRSLLGGDFYDLLERDDGSLHLLIGDVAGHGPDEAALGVALRIAWRTLVLAGIEPDRVLPILDSVLVRERRSDEVFATVCTLTVPPDRRSARLWLAGHPAPLLLDPGKSTHDAVRAAAAARPAATRPAAQLPDDLVGPALGVVAGVTWGSVEVPLPQRWRLLLFTDGLIEGRDGGSGPPAPPGRAAHRLGVDGLLRLLAQRVASVPPALDGAGTDGAAPDDAAPLADALLDAVEGLHGGELTDDVALVLVSVDSTDTAAEPAG